MNANEKKCPYCAESIKANAIKCKFCHSNLVKEKVNGDIKGAVFFIWFSWIFNIFTNIAELNHFSDTAQILVIALSFLFTLFMTKKLLEGANWVRIILLLYALFAQVITVFILIEGNVENGVTYNDKIIYVISTALIVTVTFLLFTKESSAYFQKSSNLDEGIEELKECPICTKKRLSDICECGFIFKVEKELQNERVNEKPKIKLSIYVLFLIALFALVFFSYSKQLKDNNSKLISLDEYKAYSEKDKKVELQDSSSDKNNQLASIQTDTVTNLLSSIKKNCTSPVSTKDVLTNDILLYADQKNKILVYLGRGARSSDLYIFNLKDNSFTSVNSTFPENNELHKISKFDLDRLPLPGTINGCNFEKDLLVEGLFNCNNKIKSFNCEWNFD